MVAETRNMPGDFDQYRFVRILGSGGLATVYLVENTRVGRRGVMKVGRPDLDNPARERFREEATALRQLDHPNIPVLLDVGTLPDGRPFLVTEWVKGTDLAELLASKLRFSIYDVLLLSRALAGALACAHRQNLLHLDVKPANILVPEQDGRRKFEEARLLDFSVREELHPDTHMTRAGMLVGTPYYMSPEQVRGSALTPRADIFSLGVVMYEMVSGRRPFEGATAQEMFFALLSKEPEPLTSFIPPEVADLVRRCLDKNPDKRPRSGAEMSALIDGLLETMDGLLDRPLPRLSVAQPPGASASLPSLITGHGPESPKLSCSTPSVPAEPMEGVSAKGTPPLQSKAITLAALAAVVVGFAVCAFYLRALKRPSPEVSLIALGVFLVVAGVVMGVAVRRYAAQKRVHLTGEISELLKGDRTRKALSMTLALQVDEVIAKCRLMDEKFLGLTMALMVKEYDSARRFDDRQRALMNAIAILDKLGPKLSPWYVRHEKLVATAVSLVGIISGLATAAQSIAKVIKGTP